MKRKLEDMLPGLPKTSETSVRSPNLDAPSPTSSGSDLELPDAFVQPGRSTEANQKPRENLLLLGMDLDSRITSFLAAGSHAVAVSNKSCISQNNVLIYTLLFFFF